jgi:hypothetical protein
MGCLKFLRGQPVRIRARLREVTTRRRRLVTAGVALALLLVVSWLACDWLLLGEGATRFSKPGSTEGGRSLGPPTPDRRSEAGPSGANVASGPAGKDDVGPVRALAPSPEIRGPLLADATGDRDTGQRGERSSNPTSNGSTPSGVGTAIRVVGSRITSSGVPGAPGSAASQDAGAGPSPHISARSDVLQAPMGPVIGAALPGPSAKTGFDNPDPLITGGRSGDPKAVSSTDVSLKPTTVPAPSSLLLFGTSALMLWVLFRAQRGRKDR